ncbi:MAG: respiratory chain complex I subunit 1 family protein [Coriobacteriales bacterium]
MNFGIGSVIGIVAFLFAAPVLGCLLAGIDRKLSAGLQGRVGPKLLQPYYDFRKLLDKEDATVNGAQDLYVLLYLVFIILSGVVFFAGGNFLLCVFILTLGSLFLIVAAYASRSPYAELGAQREIVQVMSYEPMVLLVAAGLFMATGTFRVEDMLAAELPAVRYAPLIFIGFVYVLTIKLRKSPFDISMSHHAHQELVRGLTTELSGKTLAMIELSHWYENILFLGWVGIFLLWGGPTPVSIAVCVVVCLAVYFLEILIDNNFARVKWQTMLKSSWLVALVLGGINIVYLLFI